MKPRRPIFRVLWLGWYASPFFQFGDGSYYGWRWWIGAGPVLILVGRAVIS